MQSEQLLTNVWGVWFSFSSGNKAQADYGHNLKRLFYLKNWADLAFLWIQSDVKDPNLFFTNPSFGQFIKFEVQGTMKKVQSINFFKDPIQPTWQFGDNSKGGYYNFSLTIDASSDTVKQIYQILVFMALGQSISFADSIRGIRVVDTASKKKFRCRFEIWVDYAEKDENLDMIKKHSYQLKQILENEKIPLAKINFYNIGGKGQNQQQKNSKLIEKTQ